MSLKLSRGEYWILNSMVEACYPLCWLGGSRPEVTFNHISSHGLSREQLVETLDELFDRRWIKAYRTHRSDDWWERYDTPFVADRASISTALCEQSLNRTVRSCVYCGLTPEGGAAWEAFASPDWGRYMDYSFGESEGTIVGAVRHRVERYLSLFGEEGYVVDPGSLIWTADSPWEATYWKTLPVGLRVTFRIQSDPRHDQFDLRQWNNAVIRSWYPKWYDWA